MEVDGNLQRFGAFEDWPKEPVIEVASSVVTIDNCSFESVFADHPLQFVSGLVRRSCGERSKPGKSCWALPDCRTEVLVGLTGKCHSIPWFELLRTRRSEREHLHVNPASSISATLFSPMSQSRSKSFAAAGPKFDACALSSCPGPTRKPGLAKCSSTAIVRIASLLPGRFRSTGGLHSSRTTRSSCGFDWGKGCLSSDAITIEYSRQY